MAQFHFPILASLLLTMETICILDPIASNWEEDIKSNQEQHIKPYKRNCIENAYSLKKNRRNKELKWHIIELT